MVWMSSITRLVRLPLLAHSLDPNSSRSCSPPMQAFSSRLRAGNTGPGAGTVTNPGPWITTAAAGTHNRSLLATVTLGNGSVKTGASAAASAVGPAPIINSSAAGLPGANAAAVTLCFSDADMNPANGSSLSSIRSRSRTRSSYANAGITPVLTRVLRSSKQAELGWC